MSIGRFGYFFFSPTSWRALCLGLAESELVQGGLQWKYGESATSLLFESKEAIRNI